MKHEDANLKSYYITTNNDYFILEIKSGNMVTSMDKFKVNTVFSERYLKEPMVIGTIQH